MTAQAKTFDEQGKPSFQLLQNNHSRALPVYLYAFDLLNRNGEALQAELRALLAEDDQ